MHSFGEIRRTNAIKCAGYMKIVWKEVHGAIRIMTCLDIGGDMEKECVYNLCSMDMGHDATRGCRKFIKLGYRDGTYAIFWLYYVYINNNLFAKKKDSHETSFQVEEIFITIIFIYYRKIIQNRPQTSNYLEKFRKKFRIFSFYKFQQVQFIHVQHS